MTFLLSNGSPATFAADRASAEIILGTDEIQHYPFSSFSVKDWAAAEAVFVFLDDESGVQCWAVAC